MSDSTVTTLNKLKKISTQKIVTLSKNFIYDVHRGDGGYISSAFSLFTEEKFVPRFLISKRGNIYCRMVQSEVTHTVIKIAEYFPNINKINIKYKMKYKINSRLSKD